MRPCLIAAAIVLYSPAHGHDGKDHATPSEARAHAATVSGPTPLPFAVGGAFNLQASTGGTRGQADPDGKMQLLFFGYASCEQICSAALPLMADIADRASASGHPVRPVMITVDPDRDTAASMADSLTAIHSDFVGLTGSQAALQTAYDAFSVERKVLFHGPEGQPIFAHGSFIYLLDIDGTVLTLIPPVLTSDAAAMIVARYADRAPG